MTTTRSTRSTGSVAFACRVLCTVAALLPANASTFVLKQLSPVVRDVPIAVDGTARQPIVNRTPPMTTTSCHQRSSDTTGWPTRRKSATMRLSSVSGAAPASVGAGPRQRASWSSMSSPRFSALDSECDATSSHQRPSDTTGWSTRRKSATMRLSSVSGAAPASVGAGPRQRASWSSMSSPRFSALDSECDATSCHKRPSDTTGWSIRRKSATMRRSSVPSAAPASVGAVPRKRASWSSMSSPRFPTLDGEPGGCDAASKTTSRFSRSANRCRARIPEYRGRNTNGEVVSKNEMTVDVDVAVPADAVPPAKTVSGYASSPSAATIVFTLFVASAALCCWFVSSRCWRRTPKRRRRSLAEYLLF